MYPTYYGIILMGIRYEQATELPVSAFMYILKQCVIRIAQLVTQFLYKLPGCLSMVCDVVSLQESQQVTFLVVQRDCNIIFSL